MGGVGPGAEFLKGALGGDGRARGTRLSTNCADHFVCYSLFMKGSHVVRVQSPLCRHHLLRHKGPRQRGRSLTQSHKQSAASCCRNWRTRANCPLKSTTRGVAWKCICTASALEMCWPHQCWVDSSQSVASHKFGDSVTSVNSQCPPVDCIASRESRALKHLRVAAISPLKVRILLPVNTKDRWI